MYFPQLPKTSLVTVSGDEFPIRMFHPDQEPCNLSRRAIADCDMLNMTPEEKPTPIPPPLRGILLPCGHFSSTKHLMDHFICKGLRCPFCDKGPKLPVCLDSLPSQWSAGYAHRYIEMGNAKITEMTHDKSCVVRMMLSELLVGVSVHFCWMDELPRVGLTLRAFWTLIKRMEELFPLLTDDANLFATPRSSEETIVGKIRYVGLEFVVVDDRWDCHVDMYDRDPGDSVTLCWQFATSLLGIPRMVRDGAWCLPAAYYAYSAFNDGRVVFDFFWKKTEDNAPWSDLEDSEYFLDLEELRCDMAGVMHEALPERFWPAT